MTRRSRWTRFERLATNPSVATKGWLDRALRGGLEKALHAVERELIVHALNKSKGNVTRAAALLRTSRQQLQRRIRQHKIWRGR